jgi:hypothetical protein
MNHIKIRVREFVFPDFISRGTDNHDLTQWHYIDKKSIRNVQANKFPFFHYLSQIWSKNYVKYKNSGYISTFSVG